MTILQYLSERKCISMQSANFIVLIQLPQSSETELLNSFPEDGIIHSLKKYFDTKHVKCMHHLK